MKNINLQIMKQKSVIKTENDCLQKSPMENCKYYTDYNPTKVFMFNGSCYKDKCPDGTILDILNTSFKNCIMKKKFLK